MDSPVPGPRSILTLIDDWMHDELIKPLVERITFPGGDVTAIQTKEFLRPIFRWMKHGSKHFDPEKAFQFSEWMVQLRYTPCSDHKN